MSIKPLARSTRAVSGRRSLVLCVAALAFSTRASAQQPAQEAPDTTAPPTPPAAIPTSQIARAAEAANSELRGIRERIGSQENLGQITTALAQLNESIDALAADESSINPFGESSWRLRNLEAQWRDYRRRAEKMQSSLDARSDLIVSEDELLQRMRLVWQATHDSAVAAGLPAGTQQQMLSLLSDVEDVQRQLRERLENVLNVQYSVSHQATRIDETLSRIKSAEDEARRRLFAPDSPPIWSAAARMGEHGSIGQEFGESWREYRAVVRRFVRDHRTALIVFLLAIGIVAALMAYVARVERDDPDVGAMLPILRRPISAAFLIGVVLTVQLAPPLPLAVIQLAVLATLIPIVRLVPALVPSSLRAPLYAIAALMVVGFVQSFIEEHRLFARLVLLAQTVAAFGVFFWVAKASGPLAQAVSGRWRWPSLAAASAGAITLGVAFLANLVGYNELAGLLTRGTVNGAYLAIVFFAAARVLAGTLRLLLNTQLARSINSIRRNQVQLTRLATTLVNIAAVVGWLVAVLSSFDVVDSVYGGLRGLLEHRWSLGALELSLGDLLIFTLALWAAVLLARVVQTVLQEEVLSRVELPRGVPHTISRLVTYAIWTIGFLFALGVAGVPLGRLTIILGALGVGIGFGLQDVVNNFVSGLILIFERPVRVGDTIQVGALTGGVKRIGIRSSTVRTFDGAEVIVPNANLISEQVINWTLSDKNKRIEIEVGVAYGTEPARVIQLLLEVARAHSEILDHPEPIALFRNFGDSALVFSLRAWSRSFDDSFRVDSELRTAVAKALTEAGIEIPFPQRDLHVRSVESGEGAAEAHGLPSEAIPRQFGSHE